MDISYFCCHRFLGDTQQNNIMADCEIMDDVIEIAQQLEACYICGRTFLPTPLLKHTRVCERNANKRRKVFDSLKQRIEGTELASFHQHSFLRKNENLPHPPVLVAPPEVKSNVTRNQSKWKEKHEELVQAIRAAKSENHIGPRRSIGAVGTMGVTERCPTCDRQFGPKAYDRHVEWCKERKTRVVRSPVNNPAKERLEARVKYRVPLPNKSRRSLTREKYSASVSQSSLGSGKSFCSMDKTNASRSPSVRKPKKQSSSTPKTNFAPVRESIIKSKSPVLDKAKSTRRKSRKRGPKVNSVNINDDLAITVSQVDLVGNRFIKNTVIGTRGIPIATNRKEDEYCDSESNKSATDIETQISYIEKHPRIEIINDMGDPDFEENTEIFEKKEFESPKSKEIYTIEVIKKPNDSYNKQSDDEDSCFEMMKDEKHEYLLNKTMSNIELSNEIGDSREQHVKSPLKNTRADEEQENNNDLSPNNVWDIAEKEFLISLKNKAETTDQFVSGLKDNFTSTPLQTIENCYADHTGSFVMRSERSDQEMFTFDSSSLVNLDVYYPTTDHCVSETIFNVEGCSSGEPRDLEPIRQHSPFEEEVRLQLELRLESPKKIPCTSSKKSQTSREQSPEEYKRIPRTRKKSRPRRNRYTVKDVNEFLSDNSHIEVEIVASESSNDDNNKKSNKKNKKVRPLKIYKSNPQEVVLQGNKCLNAVNHLFAKNQVDDVNIVVANKGLREDYTDYDSSHFDDSENYSTYEEEQYVEKYAVTTKVSKTKRNHKRNMVTVSETRETKQSVKLPHSHKLPKYVTQEEKSFWEKVAKNENRLFTTKKAVLHDFDEKRNCTNRYITRPYTNAHEESYYTLNPPNTSVNHEIPERQYPNYNPRTQLPPIIKDERVSKEEYNPFIVAEKQLMELLECDDFKPFNSSHNTPSKKVKTLPENKVSNSVKNTKSPKKRASVIEPPDDFQDNTHLMQDNFEMIENFINDNYINDDDCKKSENKNIQSKQSTKHSNNNKSGTNELLSLNSILAERKYSDDMTSIDPNLINENDNLDIPDKLLVDNDSPASCNNDIDHYSAQYDKNISMLEPLVLAKTEISNMKRSISMQENQPLDDIDFEEFISSFEDDDTFPTLKTFLHGSKTDSNTPNKKNPKKTTHSLNSSFGKNASQKVDNKKQSLSPLKRSISLSNPVVKARSMKTKQDIQDYLHVREQPGSKKMLEREKLKSVNNPKLLEEPYNQGPYEEFKKYDGYKKDTHRRPSGDIEDNSSIEDTNSEVERKHITKFSGDSAYGSLNRKSPLQNRISNRHGQVYQTQHVAVERSPSSSGSEKSVPIPSKLNAAKLNATKLTKFCHDCGTKYPLDAAKFCIECGMRRLVL